MVNRKLFLLAGSGLPAVIVLLAVSLLGSRAGTSQAVTPLPIDPDYLCANHAPGNLSPLLGTIQSDKAAIPSHSFLGASFNVTICERGQKNVDTPPTPGPGEHTGLACFDILAVDPPDFNPVATYIVSTKYTKPVSVAVHNPKELCRAVAKAAPPKPDSPLYECYAIDPFQGNTKITKAWPQLGVTVPIELGAAQRLCVPSLMPGALITKGNLAAVPLVCFAINDPPPISPAPISVVDNDGSVDLVAPEALNRYCVEAQQQVKPADDGNLSGVAEVQLYGDYDPVNNEDAAGPGTCGDTIDNGADTVADAADPDCGGKAQFLFYCILRTDHDGTTNEIKTAAACYLDAPGFEAPAPSPACATTTGPKDPTTNPCRFNIASDQSGPPPPPPYTPLAPAKGTGTYTPATDTIFLVSCFPNLGGGALGPHAIAEVTIPNAKATVGGTQTGTVDVWVAQNLADCRSGTPNAVPALEDLNVNLTRYDTAPYSADSDNDGCADGDELDKTRPVKNCGDDPYNPHDSDLDFNGPVSIGVEVTPADVCIGGQPRPNDPPPFGCMGVGDGLLTTGSYFNCQADLDHNLGTNEVTGRAWCYTDNQLTTVNFQDAGNVASCPPAPAGACGDGLAGGPPPTFGTSAGRAADNDGGAGNALLFEGMLDKVKNVLVIDSCFPSDNPLIGPFSYARSTTDAHTGIGTVDIWLNRLDCTKPTDPPSTKGAPITVAEQDADYDPDNDGCTTVQELSGSTEAVGGQRDPFNYGDHHDVNGDGAITIPGILAVAAKFGPVPAGTSGDTGPIMAGSTAGAWARRGADGTIGIPDDILGKAGIFGHNC